MGANQERLRYAAVGAAIVGGWAALSTPAPAQAFQEALPAGASLGYGEATYPIHAHSLKQNPAGAIAEVDRGFRMGVLGLGLGYEAGDVADFNDRLDAMQSDIDQIDTIYTDDIDLDFSSAGSKEEAESELQTLLDAVAEIQELEEGFGELGDEGYLGLNARGNHFPFPLDVDYSVQGRVSVVGAFDVTTPVTDWPTDTDKFEITDNCGNVSGYCLGYDEGSDGALYDEDGNEVEFSDSEFEFDTPEAYIQGGIFRTITLGYGTAVTATDHGVLFTGAHLNHHRARLSRSVVDPQQDDAADLVADEISANERRTTGLSAELGAMWVAPWYRVGASVDGLMEPTFDYPQLDEASKFDAVSEDLKYRVERQATVEGSIHTPGRNWLVSLAHDLNSVDGPLADHPEEAYQWTTLGASFGPNIVWLPAVRVGYRANNAGSELSYLTAGLSLLGIWNVDAAASLETTEGAPRSAMLNTSLDFRF